MNQKELTKTDDLVDDKSVEDVFIQRLKEIEKRLKESGKLDEHPSQKELIRAADITADMRVADEHSRQKELARAADITADMRAVDEHSRQKELARAADITADMRVADEHSRQKELARAADITADMRAADEHSRQKELTRAAVIQRLREIEKMIDKILKLFGEKFGEMTPEEQNERIAALMDIHNSELDAMSAERRESSDRDIEEINDKYGKPSTR